MALYGDDLDSQVAGQVVTNPFRIFCELAGLGPVLPITTLAAAPVAPDTNANGNPPSGRTEIFVLAMLL